MYKKLVEIEKRFLASRDVEETKKIASELNSLVGVKNVARIHSIGYALSSHLSFLRTTAFRHVLLHLKEILFNCIDIADVVKLLIDDYVTPEEDNDFLDVISRAINSNYNYARSPKLIDEMENLKDLSNLFSFKEIKRDLTTDQKASQIYTVNIKLAKIHNPTDTPEAIRTICSRMANNGGVNDPDFFLMMNTECFTYFTIASLSYLKNYHNTKEEFVLFANKILNQFFLTANLNLFLSKSKKNEFVEFVNETIKRIDPFDYILEVSILRDFLFDNFIILNDTFANHFFTLPLNEDRNKTELSLQSYSKLISDENEIIAPYMVKMDNDYKKFVLDIEMNVR
jgi:hypothetical protein